MDKRCKHRQDGFNCGSYAFNLYKDDIDQGDLCDVHYWQAKAQRTEQEPVANELTQLKEQIEMLKYKLWDCEEKSKPMQGQ